MIILSYAQPQYHCCRWKFVLRFSFVSPLHPQNKNQGDLGASWFLFSLDLDELQSAGTFAITNCCVCKTSHFTNVLLKQHSCQITIKEAFTDTLAFSSLIRPICLSGGKWPCTHARKRRRVDGNISFRTVLWGGKANRQNVCEFWLPEAWRCYDNLAGMRMSAVPACLH